MVFPSKVTIVAVILAKRISIDINQDSVKEIVPNDSTPIVFFVVSSPSASTLHPNEALLAKILAILPLFLAVA